MKRYRMSESIHRVFTSCLTIVIVIGLFLCILFIIGAGVLIFGSMVSGL
jgi:hypothetical protein